MQKDRPVFLRFLWCPVLGCWLGAPGAAQEQAPAREGFGLDVPGIRKLTIDGQYRVRYENRLDFDFDADRGASNDFFTQRVRLGFDFDLNDTLSVFAQLQDTREWGEESSTLDGSADGFDFHEARLNVHEVPGIGGEARIGRQAIALGAQRLISSLEWKSEARAFDGILQTWNGAVLGGSTLHVFGLMVRERLNAANDDAWVLGAYGTAHPFPRTTADVYMIYLHDDEAAAGGAHNRVTLGTRWQHGVGGFLFETEAATQAGEISGAEIPFGETFAAHAHVRYTFENCAWRPWIQVEGDLASGNDPDDRDNARFDSLFPFSHAYWGYMDLALWENLQHAAATVGASPCERAEVRVFWHFFAAMEEGDRFGGPNGVLSSGAPGRSRTVGNELDVKVNWDFAMEPVNAGLELGYAFFLPGPAVKAEKGSDDLAHFVYVQTDVRF